MKKDTKNPKLQVVQITSLEQMKKMAEMPLEIRFKFEGKILAVEARRLRPDEDAILDDIILSVPCPVLRGKTIEEDRANWNDPDYITKKNAAEIQARALGIYWCVPIFSRAKPNLTDRKAITEFVQSHFNAVILNMFWQEIRSGGVSKADQVSFSSASGLPPS